jgi:hypothetical protein
VGCGDAAQELLDEAQRDKYAVAPRPSRRWRNWQTHWIQVPASAAVEKSLAFALAAAAEAGRWRLAERLLRELEARRTNGGAS